MLSFVLRLNVPVNNFSVMSGRKDINAVIYCVNLLFRDCEFALVTRAQISILPIHCLCFRQMRGVDVEVDLSIKARYLLTCTYSY